MTTETSNARGEWVLVPREPTEAMIEAGNAAAHAGGCDLWQLKREVMNAWPAMLAAAPPPAAAQQPDHLVDANKMVAQQLAGMAPRAWLCTFGEVSGVTDDPKWRDMCARLGQQITPLGPIFTQQPAAVDEVEGLKRLVRHLAGNPDFDFVAALATQHQEPTS